MCYYDIGLTCGVFDLFHIGHLNILKKCKKYCKYLIVSILTDEYCLYRKNKFPIINQNERYQIIKSIKYVDKVIYQNKDFQVINFIKKYNINIVFKGSDKLNDPRWIYYKKEFHKMNVILKFFKYTNIISTTKIIKKCQML